MITPKLIGALNKIQHKETASDIVRVMSYSGIELLKNILVILFTLNSHVVQLVLSNPKLPLRSCFEFFNFLRQSPFNKPDLVAHMTLIRRLHDRRKFTDIQFVLNCIANDVNLRTSVSNIVSLVEDDTDDPIFFKSCVVCCLRCMLIMECWRKLLGFLIIWRKVGLRFITSLARHFCLL
ncbi:hypothetical protein Ddye_032186 [Dipteronia dyeriana]|uniref:Uncharacterized protein n=1 Tax=Dipteronia dyeriana TaxID=168575 RepID=A0AAD9WMZ7_9ROSI|nr:hypothetical protein Ddye_032186 [Dipteronia dyeriana]